MADSEGEFPHAMLDSLLDAAVGRAPWEPVLQDTAEHFGAEGAVMVAYNATSEVTIASAGVIEPANRYNVEGWAQHDVRARAAVRLRNQTVVIDQDIGPLDQLQQTPFYAEFMRPAGFAWHAAVKFQTGGRLWALSFQRGVGRKPFTMEEKKRLARFAGPLGLVGSIAREVGISRLRGTLEGLDAIARPAVAIDRSGRICDRNRAAEAIEGIGYRISSGRITAVLDDDSANLASLISSLFGSVQSSGPLQVLLGTLAGSFHLVRGLPLIDFGDHPFEEATGILLFTSLDSPGEPCHACFADLFDLTPAEAALANLIGGGLTLADACTALSITQNTGRDRLKTIFTKTGTHRQSELVGLWLRLTL